MRKFITDFMSEADREIDTTRRAETLKTLYKYNYFEPERLTSAQIRQRRLTEQLRRTRLELEDQPERLSPANKFHAQRLKEFQEKFERELNSHKEALNRGIPFSKARKSRLFQLLAMQQHFGGQRTSERRPSSVAEKPFVDRAFDLTPRVNIPRVFRNPKGTFVSKMAWISQPQNMPSYALKKIAANIPCVQRQVRKEVLFAKNKAGKGHRSPHHKGPYSHIGC